MMCAGFFERLLRQQQLEEDVFKNQVLHEIDMKKEQLQRELRNLQIAGKHHLAVKVHDRLVKLEKITERMKQLLTEA